jgi:hypothetical protein
VIENITHNFGVLAGRAIRQNRLASAREIGGGRLGVGKATNVTEMPNVIAQFLLRIPKHIFVVICHLVFFIIGQIQFSSKWRLYNVDFHSSFCSDHRRHYYIKFYLILNVLNFALFVLQNALKSDKKRGILTRCLFY